MLNVVHSVGCWLEQTQTWIYTQVANLPSDIQSHVVCDHTQNLDQFPVASLHSLDRTSTWERWWERGLRNIHVRPSHGFLGSRAARASARILHSHFAPIGWRNVRAAARLGLKHVVTFYGYDVNYLPKSNHQWGSRYAELFAHVDLVLCEGPHMAQSVVALGCPAHKMRVHHLGVMLERLPFRPRQWTPGEPLRVLIAASFREKKGIPYALEALARVQDELNLEVTIIGDATAVSAGGLQEKQKILDVIDKHSLGAKTRMLGFQPYDVLLQEADRHHIYLAPSVTAASGDTEGGAPVSIIEMAALGMPVLSTFHCDIPEVIQDGVTGLLAKERDVDGLVDRLRWLVANPDGWLPMLQKARVCMESEFAAETQGRRLGEIYRELASQ